MGSLRNWTALMADSSRLRKLPMGQGRPTRWGLNHGPVARHAHISCSPLLSDVQNSPNRSTYCPQRFVVEFTYSPALLTALLTKRLCKPRKGSQTAREARLVGVPLASTQTSSDAV